jgi:thiamine biosynthesis lipoprotein
MGVQWQAWGTTVRVEVTDPAALAAGRRIVLRTILEAERAADADRPGAEVHRLLRSAGRDLPVRPTLSALVATALDAAEQSGGLVDPSVGAATIPLRRASGRSTRPASWGRRSLTDGSDGWFPVCAGASHPQPRPAAGWRTISWSERRVGVPAGTALDLTATAKARTARLAAARVAEVLGVGALVDLGGDVAAAGPPPGHGWVVRPAQLGSPVLELPAGTALATCRAAGIVDPATGRPVTGPWSAVCVAAPDVVLAKTAAVAALVHGEGAEAYLDRLGLAAVFLAAPGRDRDRLHGSVG